MIKELKRILLLTIIFFRGIKFFETCYKPLSNEFREVKFVTIKEHIIEFSFYKESIKSISYKRRQIYINKSIVYLIQSRFDASLPKKLSEFNNLKFMFHNDHLYFFDDDIICDTLLSIYLKFIKKEIEQQ